MVLEKVIYRIEHIDIKYKNKTSNGCHHVVIFQKREREREAPFISSVCETCVSIYTRVHIIETDLIPG